MKRGAWTIRSGQNAGEHTVVRGIRAVLLLDPSVGQEEAFFFPSPFSGSSDVIPCKMPAQHFPLLLFYETQFIFILREFSLMLSSYSSSFHPCSQALPCLFRTLLSAPTIISNCPYCPMQPSGTVCVAQLLEEAPGGSPSSCLLSPRSYPSSKGMSLPPLTLWLALRALTAAA